MSHAAWMLQAESDLAAAKLLSVNDQHPQAIWFAGQAVEKAHKAVLVALGLRYQESHFKKFSHTTSEVANLLPAALHEPTDPQIGAKLEVLEKLAMSSRYPAPAQGSQWISPGLLDAQFGTGGCRRRALAGLVS